MLNIITSRKVYRRVWQRICCLGFARRDFRKVNREWVVVGSEGSLYTICLVQQSQKDYRAEVRGGGTGVTEGLQSQQGLNLAGQVVSHQLIIRANYCTFSGGGAGLLDQVCVIARHRSVIENYNYIKDNFVKMGSALYTGHAKMNDGTEQVPYEFNQKDMVKIHKKTIYDDFVLYELRGKGSSAEVYRAVQKNGKIDRAVKVVRRKKEGDGLSTEHMNEYNILKKLDHPNILKVFDIYEEGNKYYIVTELCSGGELLDRIVQNRGFTEVDACYYFYQIISTVSYLHENHFMHRDIKPQNLLFTDKTEKATIKLVDFGSACYFENSELIERKRVGTSYYIAPEVLQRRYNQKCDIWSAGVILFILLSGETPFTGKNDNQIIKHVQTGEYNFSSKIWKTISVEAKDLICRMLEINPKKRICAKDVLKHPWINKFTKENHKGGLVLQQCLQNIRKYNSVKKIQEGVLIFIMNFLTTNQERQRVMKAFRQIDTNGDGIISRAEMKKAFESNDSEMMNSSKFNELFDKIDKDKSGFIDYSEFLMASMNVQSSLTQEKLEAAFKMMDFDDNGTISVAQLKDKLGSSIPESAFSVFLKEFDKNKDGQISREEFVQMMKRISLKTC